MQHGVRLAFVELDKTTLLQHCAKRLFTSKISSIKDDQMLADLENPKLKQYCDRPLLSLKNPSFKNVLLCLWRIEYGDVAKVNARGSLAWGGGSPCSYEILFCNRPLKYQMTHDFRLVPANLKTRKHLHYCITPWLALKISSINMVLLEPLHIAHGVATKCIALVSLVVGGASPCSRGRLFPLLVECTHHAILPFFGNGTHGCDEMQPHQQITLGFSRVFVELDKTNLFQHWVKRLIILKIASIKNVQLDLWHIEHATKVICSCQRPVLLWLHCTLLAVIRVYCDERLSRCETTHDFRLWLADLDKPKLRQYCDTPLLSLNTSSFKNIPLDRWHLKHNLKVWVRYTTLLSVGLVLGAYQCAQKWSLWFQLRTQMKLMHNQLVSCLSTLEDTPSQATGCAHQSHSTLRSSMRGCCVVEPAVQLSTRSMDFVSASATGHASREAAPLPTGSDKLILETFALHFGSTECQSSDSAVNTGLRRDHNACATSRARADWLGA
jgi:hypothetical protein